MHAHAHALTHMLAFYSGGRAVHRYELDEVPLNVYFDSRMIFVAWSGFVLGAIPVRAPDK